MKKLIYIHFISTVFCYSYSVQSLQSLAKQNILQQIKGFPHYTLQEKKDFNIQTQNQYNNQKLNQVITPDILDLKNENFKYLNLSEIRLWDTNLESCIFEGANLQNADLQGCVLKNANFNNANLRKARLIGVDLKDCCFKGASLQKAWLTPTLQLPDYKFPAEIIKFYCSLPDSEDKKILNELIGRGSFDLRLQHLEGLNLAGINFKNCDLTCAYLQGANLTDVQLENTSLRGAKLSQAILSKDFTLPQEASPIDLIRLYAKETTTQNQKDLLNKILGSGFVKIGQRLKSDIWNTFHDNIKINSFDLSHLNLQGINLSKSFIAQVDLQGANLIGANLNNALFHDSKLQGALLFNGFKVPNYQDHNELIKLYSESKEKENLNQFFNIIELDLTNGNFSDLKLAGINLSKATFNCSYFYNTDLTKAIIKNNKIDYLHQAHFSNAILPNGFKVPNYQNHDELIKFYSDSKEKEDLNQLFDLLYIDLRNKDFSNKDFSNLDLSGIHLNNAYIYETKFQNTNLTNALLKIYAFSPENIRGVLLSPDFKVPDYQNSADLIKMYSNSQDPKEKENLNKLFAIFKLNLSNTDLSGLNLAKVNLTGFDLCGADLSGTDLTDAILDSKNISSATLKGTQLSKDFTLPLDMSPQKAVEMYANPKTTQEQKDLLNKILHPYALYDLNRKNLNLRGIDLTKFDIRNYLFSCDENVDIRKAHTRDGVTIPEYQDPKDLVDFQKEMYETLS